MWKINLFYCSKFNYEALMIILEGKYAKNLRSLIVTKISDVHNDLVPTIVKNCPQLERIWLDESRVSRLEAIFDFWAIQPSLRVLEVGEFEKLGCKWIQVFRCWLCQVYWAGMILKKLTFQAPEVDFECERYDKKIKTALEKFNKPYQRRRGRIWIIIELRSLIVKRNKTLHSNKSFLNRI